VRVAIFDTGFDTQNPAFTSVTVTAQHDFVFHDNVVRDEPGIDVAGAQSHGTAVWSLFAGDVPGRLRGIAPDATYLLAKTEDVRTETRVEEDNYVAALQWADSIGVDIVSSSLAYLIFDNGFSYTHHSLNGDVALTTVAVDAAARRGITVVTAAGNEGPGFRTVWTPGDADSALTIGAEDSLGNIAIFSSRGPTADGRLKPDFTAPGVAVCVVDGTGCAAARGRHVVRDAVDRGRRRPEKELFPTLRTDRVADTLRAFASHRAAPDSVFGWGRPDFAASAGLAFTQCARAPRQARSPRSRHILLGRRNTVRHRDVPAAHRARQLVHECGPRYRAGQHAVVRLTRPLQGRRHLLARRRTSGHRRLGQHTPRRTTRGAAVGGSDVAQRIERRSDRLGSADVHVGSCGSVITARSLHV